MKRFAAVAAGAAAATVLLLGSGTPIGAQPTTTTVYSLGSFGPTGDGSPVSKTPTPVTVPCAPVTQLVATNAADYALCNGKVWAWGEGTDGELGDGGTPGDPPPDSWTTPVQVLFDGNVTISSLSDPGPAGTEIAIDDTTNTAYGWGNNIDGSLCLGNNSRQYVPIAIPIPDVTLASGGGGHAEYYSATANKIIGCGLNDDGELGRGADNFTTNLGQHTVKGLPEEAVVALTASYEGSGALLANHEYYDWGLDDHGQLGNGSNHNTGAPQLVTLPGSVTQVYQGGSDASNGQTLAIVDDNGVSSVFGWGSDTYGQLCDDNSGQGVSVSSPEQLPVSWTTVRSGGATSYGIDASGNLFACGSNSNGQLGNNNTGGESSTPYLIGAGYSAVDSTAHNAAAF